METSLPTPKYLPVSMRIYQRVYPQLYPHVQQKWLASVDIICAEPKTARTTGLHGIRHARGTQTHGEDQPGGQGRHEPGEVQQPLSDFVVI